MTPDQAITEVERLRTRFNGKEIHLMNETFADRLINFIANDRQHFSSTTEEIVDALEGAMQTLEAEDTGTSAEAEAVTDSVPA